jgi:WD40 repeat protein/transcriptional regulator with XRE-family HTH domain
MDARLPFHEQLRRERERRGWSQEDLAEKVSSDTRTISRWESGISLPRPYFRQKLSELLGKDAEELGFFVDMMAQPGHAAPSLLPNAHAVKEDWGEAPYVTQLFGRDQEVAALRQWIVEERCRVAAVVGMGGMGKTTLTSYASRLVSGEFAAIFWRSLQHTPPLKQFLQQCLQCISPQDRVEVPEAIDEQLSLLMHSLRNTRCLLILDNVESILQEGQHAGYYHDGYAGYGQLIRRIAETDHQSCLLITSREKPREVSQLEGHSMPVYALHLHGIAPEAGKIMLQGRELAGSAEEWAKLVSLYAGNPLALRIVAELVQEIFDGDIARFLREETIAFGDILRLLEQQFQRLSLLEQELLSWLAIEREPTALDTLRENLIDVPTRAALLDALDSLRRRSLIEIQGTAHFTLQTVIMEYVAARLVKQACEEAIAAQMPSWRTYAFVKAQSKAYLRDAQTRLLLAPIAASVLRSWGKQMAEQQLRAMLARERLMQPRQCSYLATNVLSLLVYLGYDLRGIDCSYLTVRQAHLQHVALPVANFSHADVVSSTFAHTFGNVLSIAFSPQADSYAIGTADGNIWLYHAKSGTPLQTYRGHTDGVWSLVFSRDAAFLASSSDDQTARIWNVATGECLRMLHFAHRVRSVDLNHDGTLLASGSDDHMIRLWDASSGTCLSSLVGHEGRVWSVAFNPSGTHLASGGTDCSVRLWNVASGQAIGVLQGHTNNVRSVVFGATGALLASGSDDGTVRLWNVQTGQCSKTLQGHTNRVWSLAAHPQAPLLASGSEDYSVRLWDANTGQCLKVLDGHEHGVRAVAFSPTGSLLVSGGDDQALRLWDSASGECVQTLQGYTNRVWSLAFHPQNQRLASCSEDQLLRLWDGETRVCIRVRRASEHGGRALAFHPRGHLLASGGEDQTVRLWDSWSLELVSILRGHTNWVRTVAFSPDGQWLASGSEDNTVRLWDVETGQCRSTLQGHTSWLRAVAFSTDGRLLASAGDDQQIRLWELATLRCLHTLKGHCGRVRDLAFSFDGATLASASEDETVRLWKIDTGEPCAILRGHTGWVRALAYHPDGHLLATGGDDHSIRIWSTDAQQQEPLAILWEHSNRVRWLAYSHDGSMLASASDDGTIKLRNAYTLRDPHTLLAERPYEQMNIALAEGLTGAQKIALKTLGAID